MAAIRIPDAPNPPAGGAVRVEADGTPIALFRVGERLLAVDARCTHVGGPLDRGRVANLAVTCPLHGSVFSLETGQVQRGPASRPVRAYRAAFEGTTLVLEPL